MLFTGDKILLHAPPGIGEGKTSDKIADEVITEKDGHLVQLENV